MLKFFCFVLFCSLTLSANFENLFEKSIPIQIPFQRSLLQQKIKFTLDEYYLIFSVPKQWKEVTNNQFSKKFLNTFLEKNKYREELKILKTNNYFFLHQKSKSFLYINFVSRNFISKFNSNQKEVLIKKLFINKKQKAIEVRVFKKPYFLATLFFKPLQEKNKIPMFIYGFQKKYFQQEAPKVASSISSVYLKKKSSLKEKIKNFFE